MNLATIWAIANKDLRQFLRDRTMVLFLILLPVMQLLLMVQATGRGALNVPIAVLDLDRSSDSRALIALLDASDSLNVTCFPETLEAGVRALEAGEVMGLFIIPQGLAANLANPIETMSVQFIIDGTSSLLTRIVEGAGQQVIQRFLMRRGGQPMGGVQVATLMRYNPSVQTRPYTIGAQLGFITYQVTLGVAALGLAREQELGTMEQLMVTPVRRSELLLGKVISPTLVGLFDFLLLSVVIVYIFDVPVRGSYPFLLACSVVFIAVEVIWGTMLSSLAGTQQQAILLVFIQAMVDIALSGYLVPVTDLPPVMGLIAQAVPLHHYLIIVRSVLLKGAGPVDLWPHLVGLVGIGLLISVVAMRAIARRLD